jgi:hypothetical protein
MASSFSYPQKSSSELIACASRGAISCTFEKSKSLRRGMQTIVRLWRKTTHHEDTRRIRRSEHHMVGVTTGQTILSFRTICVDKFQIFYPVQLFKANENSVRKAVERSRPIGMTWRAKSESFTIEHDGFLQILHISQMIKASGKSTRETVESFKSILMTVRMQGKSFTVIRDGFPQILYPARLFKARGNEFARLLRDSGRYG